MGIRSANGSFYDHLMAELNQSEKVASAGANSMSAEAIKSSISAEELEALADALDIELDKEAGGNVGYDRNKASVEDVDDKGTTVQKDERLEAKTKANEEKVRTDANDGGVGPGHTEDVDDNGTTIQKDKRLEAKTKANEEKVRTDANDGGVGSGHTEDVDDKGTTVQKDKRLEAKSKANAEKVATAKLTQILKVGAEAEELLEVAASDVMEQVEKEAAFGIDLAAIANALRNAFPRLSFAEAGSLASKVAEKARLIAQRTGRSAQQAAMDLIAAMKKRMSGMARTAAESEKDLVKQAIRSGLIG